MIKSVTFIISFFLCFLSFSQHKIEICENEPVVTSTYWVETDYPASLVWTLNGVTYNQQQLTVEWDSVGVYDIIVYADTDVSCPSDTQRIQVIVERCDQLIYFIPNSFTPDEDIHNNTFQPVFTEGFDPYDFHMIIFNRWGEIIFESYDASRGWNGNYGGIKCQDGVYTWKIDFGLPEDTDERILITGHVVLIR